MNILERIFNSDMGYNAIPYPQSAEYAASVRLKERNYENLVERLDEEEKEIFAKYRDAQDEFVDCVIGSVFTYALKLGVRLMAEALAGG